MASKPKEEEPINYGTFTNEDGIQRVAGTPEEAVRLQFDGWRLAKDPTAPEAPIQQ